LPGWNLSVPRGSTLVITVALAAIRARLSVAFTRGLERSADDLSAPFQRLRVDEVVDSVPPAFPPHKIGALEHPQVLGDG